MFCRCPIVRSVCPSRQCRASASLLVVATLPLLSVSSTAARALLVLHSGITIYNGKRRLSSATNLRYFTSSQIRALSSTARSSTALLLELFRPFYLSRSLTGFILSGSYEFIKSSRKVRPALCEVKINVNAF